ncbi:hypothetical protein [Natronosporangium hydrolyticum]|uniref:hypothetical protein n=1 Tax=Natronosporangium hydrolyticum TaxID=2811111 RepID=UPI001EFA24DC|nr:hypothetical protein [Natronosporangium hydrolyticum]
MIVLGGLTAWLGLIEAPLPAAIEQGRATIPIWRLLALAAAVLPVLALASPLADLEEVATSRLRAAQRTYLAVLSLAGAAIYLGLSALAVPVSVVGMMARSWLGWLGLALLAGAVLGWRLAWTLPVTVAVVLWYWGLHGEQYRWWEFSARPIADLPSLVVSVALLSVGLVAYAATPWRRSRWRTLRAARSRRNVS